MLNMKASERLKVKKRKLEVLLDLMEGNDKMEPRPKLKAPESLSQSYQELKQQLKEYAKKPVLEPEFTLSRRGVKTKVASYLNPGSDSKSDLSLCSEDLYCLLSKSVIGHNSLQEVKWAELANPQSISRTVLLVVEGISVSDFVQNVPQGIKDVFPTCLRVVTPNVPFSKELSMLHLKEYKSPQSKDFKSVVPIARETEPVDDNFSRLHLLLSPIQLAMEHYPLPNSVFQHSTNKSDNYVFTKEKYAPVTPNSPMFAVDCEMCQAGPNQKVLTSVAIVDENSDLLYHSLVKPEVDITNYLTKYSGITKEMLENVTVKLRDVQAHIQAILPPDAILCGQSLNFDLHALQMIHPYCIDTSIIFNSSGVRGKKESLKKLSKAHLDEDIQDPSRYGHDPIEDAAASMKLVKLKLKNSVIFGDKCLESTSVTPNNSKADVSDGFFAKLKSHSKKVGLFGSEDVLASYDSDGLGDDVVKHSKSNLNQIKKSTVKHMSASDLIISHFNFKSSQGSVEDLNEIVSDIRSGCDDKTMLMMFLSGFDNQDEENIKKGLFLPVLVRKPKTN